MRILLVEDHLPLAESVAQALRGAGLTVDVLHDGVAAEHALAVVPLADLVRQAVADHATLAAAKRMALLPFATISSRLGGALILVLASLMVRMLGVG